MNSSDFYFRFNQSTSLKHFEIVDRSLSSSDLCRVANIPSHIPVKLLYDNQCSCTIYYLYRHLHHKLLLSTLKDLAPLCYSNMSFDEIEYAENECLFQNQISDCQQMEGEIQINIPQGICQDKFNTKNKPKTNSSFVIILIILACLISSIAGIYILYSNNRRLLSWNFLMKCINRNRQSSTSYQQLTQESNNEMRKIIVKYNSTTQQAQPFLATDKSDFIQSNDHDEDIPFRLNTNQINDVEDNTL
jgi:hypothetical protein